MHSKIILNLDILNLMSSAPKQIINKAEVVAVKITPKNGVFKGTPTERKERTVKAVYDALTVGVQMASGLLDATRDMSLANATVTFAIGAVIITLSDV